MTSDRASRVRDRLINRLSGSDGIGRAELAKLADSNDYRRGAADLDQLVADGTIERATDGKYHLSELARIQLYKSSEWADRIPFQSWEQQERARHRTNARNRRRTRGDSTPEPADPADFWAVGETIPAGEPAIVRIPGHPPIEIPAQPFAWQPQVQTTGPHNVAVMTLPVTADAPTRESFWDAAEA